ncbi:heat shock protein DnaJ domain protein [Rhizobium sp. PDO1-076]|uniref:DnaJ domain-containing protein n=1 Tax=Rhizobium sp. PDO1-076 TaxID=1125979 RepID=UPI00024E2D55|nr:DnaJ domain-containing protein [Rhizobium sp. PDO1-076]EHS50365.1 heat shock protein DnaJ domain protein [Rhizobium sp. PDO1-076]
MRDFYSVLGVKRDAGADEIKAAWRSKAKSVHPDQNRDDPLANNRFAEIGRAYEVLKDPAKRNRYDQQRVKVEAMEREQTIMQQRQSAREAAEKAKQAKANAERILAELAQAEAAKAKADTAAAQAAQAAKAAQAQAQKTQAQAQTAQAQSAQTNAKAEQTDASQGQSTHPSQQTQSTAGAGQQDKKAGSASAQSGKPEGPEDLVSRIFGESPEAAAVAESLKRDAEAAELNEGTPLRAPSSPLLAPIELISSLVRRIRGVPPPPPEKAPDVFSEAVVAISDLLEQKSVPITLNDGREVRVPLDGVTDGHVVRLKAQGLKFQGMQRGDVAVTIKVMRSEKFLVDAYDIRTVLPITLENAVLGCDVEVEGLEGMVKVTVPAWSNSDQVIRIDALGLPDGAGGRGALLVELRVMLWEKPDEKVTDLMRLMREGLYL